MQHPLKLGFFIQPVHPPSRPYADVLKAGKVFIFDTDGIQINRQSVEDFDRRQLWVDISITVGKVLGILAALVTLRYVIQAVGRATKLAENVKEG